MKKNRAEVILIMLLPLALVIAGTAKTVEDTKKERESFERVNHGLCDKVETLQRDIAGIRRDLAQLRTLAGTVELSNCPEADDLIRRLDTRLIHADDTAVQVVEQMKAEAKRLGIEKGEHDVNDGYERK